MTQPPTKALDLGVRTFAVTEGAARRREKRLERKHVHRRRQRIAKLKQFSQQHGLLPKDSSQLASLMRKTPYLLRAQSTQDDLYRQTLPPQNIHQIVSVPYIGAQE